MEGKRLTTLEQALSELQAKDANTQHKLDILISHIPQSKNPIPSIQITSVTPKAHSLKLALPLELDGDRTKGMAFLNSCQVYICLCPNSFTDKQAKIVWAMSYMKAGWAAKWSARVFQWEEQPEHVGYHKFVDWEDFWDKFKREFCPVYADSAAINWLESTAYFQKSRSVDEYLNEFQDLIMEAGYSDPKTIVVKFHRGLDTQILNAIATIPSGRPSNMVPTDWYTADRTIDQNRATNEAFKSSYQTPSVALTPSRPATFNIIQFQTLERSANHQHTRTPRNPVPMDIDASWKTQPLLFSCYWCGKAGQKAPDCPTWFDIWELSIDDLQTYPEDRCYNFDWFRLYSCDQRQLIAKDVRFQRLKRMPWVLFQGIVLGSS